MTTPESLRNIIREEIDSALLNRTCDCNALVSRLDVINSKIDDLGCGQNRPANSCAEILINDPAAPSGYYEILNATGQVHRVYCDMTRSCGGDTGGWMRVAYLDMTNSTHQCPSGLQQRTDNGVHTCIPTSSQRTCSSVFYDSFGISYSKVCGKIQGYHIATLDGFNYPDINVPYVDGVSLTRGDVRQHIWTFAARVWCPCGTPPAFVGNHYFCDGASSGFREINLDEPLWDGQCNSNTCCTTNVPPWFYRELTQAGADDIEMRLCRDQNSNDEDIAVGAVEIYVK